MTSIRRPTAAPALYQLALPAGWARIPVAGPGDATSTVLNAILDRSFCGWPLSESAALRRRLGEDLRASIDRARSIDTLDLYVPVAPVGGAPLACSFGVGAFRSPDSVTDPFEMLLAIAARDSSARAVDIDGSVAVRRASRRPRNTRVAATADDDPIAAVAGQVAADREISYVLGIPGDSKRWLTITFNGLEFAGAPEAVEATIQLFDAIVGSFTWRY